MKRYLFSLLLLSCSLILCTKNKRGGRAAPARDNQEIVNRFTIQPMQSRLFHLNEKLKERNDWHPPFTSSKGKNIDFIKCCCFLTSLAIIFSSYLLFYEDRNIVSYFSLTIPSITTAFAANAYQTYRMNVERDSLKTQLALMKK